MMATKLKNLKITSVDLVEQGANPEAHIKLYKSKDGDDRKADGKNSLLERLAQKLAAVCSEFLGEKELTEPKEEAAPKGGVDTPEPTEDKKSEAAKAEEDVISLDCSKLSVKEKKFLWELARRYSGAGKEPSPTAQVAKAKAELALVEKELQRAKTMAIAKEYMLLGKSADNLCDTLLNLQAASPQGYQAYLDCLEEQKMLIEKTGIFNEVGKQGQGVSGGDGWGKIIQAADRLQKEEPGLSRASAIQKACEQYPQLVEDYEENL